MVQYKTGLRIERVDADHLKLTDPFIVLDNGKEWIAPADMITDGKSVPPWLRPLIGDPFEGVTLPAAVIHDRYCKTKTRSQKETHEIFYHLVLHEMRIKYNWFLRWTWQYHRAWLMWRAVVRYNKFKNPDWD